MQRTSSGTNIAGAAVDPLSGADDPRLALLSPHLAASIQSALLKELAPLRAELRAAREELKGLAPLREELRAMREELRAAHGATLELRDELLLPARIAAREERNREKRAHSFISALIVTAQNGFGRDVAPFLALCRETWGEEVLWDAVKDIPSPTFKRTRLMFAAQKGDVERLRWLLARGAQLELKDSAGCTALFWASMSGRTEVVRELVARGAAVDKATNDGASPLHIASFYGHLEVVRELLARGAAVDATFADGYTLLFIASTRGHLEVARELLARGAIPGRAAKDGATALSVATAFGHTAVAQLLRAALASRAVPGHP